MPSAPRPSTVSVGWMRAFALAPLRLLRRHYWLAHTRPLLRLVGGLRSWLEEHCLPRDVTPLMQLGLGSVSQMVVRDEQLVGALVRCCPQQQSMIS